MEALAEAEDLRREEGQEPEERPPRFGFKDIIAFTIAAYEVILPILLLFAGAIALIYLVFRFLLR